MSPISLVQLAGSVRKLNIDSPFILPILLIMIGALAGEAYLECESSCSSLAWPSLSTPA